MTDDEFFQVVRTGERAGVEFKGPRARTDKPQFCEVVRAVLGMANRRDGGLVVIGVDRTGGAVGLSEVQAQSWADRDHVRATLAPYADPFVEMDVELKSIAEPGDVFGRRFVILHVHQFDEIPVLCGRVGRNPQNEVILKVGALYVRSRETEATVQVSTQAQMRELIELAVDRGVRAWVTRNEAAGVGSNSAPRVNAEELFRRERQGFDE